MKLGRDVSHHNELDNWRNRHRYKSVMATIWLFLTISETDPGLWDRLNESELKKLHCAKPLGPMVSLSDHLPLEQASLDNLRMSGVL